MEGSSYSRGRSSNGSIFVGELIRSSRSNDDRNEGGALLEFSGSGDPEREAKVKPEADAGIVTERRPLITRDSLYR